MIPQPVIVLDKYAIFGDRFVKQVQYKIPQRMEDEVKKTVGSAVR
jgi:hypothetical protein